MKIFFPLEVFYPSQAGGPANSIYWITKNLKQFDIESIIVSTDKGIDDSTPIDEWMNLEFGQAIYIKTFRYNFPLKQTFVALRHFIKGDIVHISSIFFPTAFVIALTAKLFKKKILLSARGELDTTALKHSSYKKKPVLWMLRKFLGTYPTFHSTCIEESVYIQSAFGVDVKIVQIPNFIDLPVPFERIASKYILFIGRFHPKKAIDNLIYAVSRSTEFLNSEYILKIAGTGKESYEAFLRDLVKELNLEDKIEFTGQVEGIDKEKLYADAYFTIMPSHTENFGNVILESLAQSTPASASIGTPWKSLVDESIGFWIDNSVENLTQHLSDLINIEEVEYLAMRQRCRPFVEREFDIKTNIHKWVEVYQNLL